MPLPIDKETLARLFSEYETTTHTISEIATICGISLSSACKYIRQRYSAEHIKTRGTAKSVESNTSTYRVDISKVREACRLFQYTDMPVAEIEQKLCITGRTMRKYVYAQFSKRFIAFRHNKLRKLLYLRNTGAGNGSYKGGAIITKDASGFQYRAILKPAWYKGSGFNKGTYVREHIVNVCIGLGIQNVPEGFVVHHCDGDTFNNRFDNLVLLPNELHTELHQFLRKRATTISKESTLKWLEEARGFRFERLKMI